jgi:DNA-binding NarL/FixJ family response regulator
MRLEGRQASLAPRNGKQSVDVTRNQGAETEREPVARPVRVLIVQDHPLLASAIAKVLDGQADLTVTGISVTAAEAVRAAARDKPDVVLLDYRLPDLSGPGAAEQILDVHPLAAIVFHGADDSEAAPLDAIDAGASAFLTRSATGAQIVEAVRRAAQGEIQIPVELFAKAIARQRKTASRQSERNQLMALLTRRELEVLNLLARGLDTVGIAGELGIANHTVEWHVRHLIEKLGVHSKLQAVVKAARKGLIQL